ncbi:hypothetical protein Tco_0313095 [Tanacetum coccineum]
MDTDCRLFLVAGSLFIAILGQKSTLFATSNTDSAGSFVDAGCPYTIGDDSQLYYWWAAIKAEEMPSVISCWMAAKVMAGVSDVDVLLGGILST